MQLGLCALNVVIEFSDDVEEIKEKTYHANAISDRPIYRKQKQKTSKKRQCNDDQKSSRLTMNLQCIHR